MATTTNYGWTTPDDTALVKDGASAIRTLGSSIDTTTKALNPSTTLGDIEYRSSTANTNTRLGIGSTGNVLTVTGGVPVWATPASGSMTEIATGSLSGTSVTISSIPATYKQLTLWLINVANTTGDASRIQFNGDTNSVYQRQTISSSVSYPAVGNFIDILNANDGSFCFFNIQNYASTTARLKCITGAGGGTSASITLSNCGYYPASAAAISSIRLFTNSTAFTGTYILYGVN